MKAKVTVHKEFEIGAVDERIYSAFLEHLGRAVYGGVYEPGHKTADEDGFREDVLDLVRDLNPPLVRYPGGNFVSNYNWEDGVGPRDQRPRRLDYAWRTTETNAFGTDEFARWCARAGTAPMLALNLGSRGLEQALAYVEYCNQPSGSAWSDLRRQHGRKDPYDVRVWCLGNEMDGPWQIGHRTAYEYGRVANEVGRAMKNFDRKLELVVCGSSYPGMPTYPSWERETLEQCYEIADLISLHIYFENYENDYLNFVAKPVVMERYIDTIIATADHVKAQKRSKHTVNISFDEWNVWYHNRKADHDNLRSWNWPVAPHLLEDVYNFEDALVCACTLNTFLRRADRVKVACIAQLVNVIAPIMTEDGGPAWKQTTYFPLYFASRYGRGTSLNVRVDVPGYDAAAADDVPYLDVAAVVQADGRSIAFFMVNRHADEAMSIDVELAGFRPTGIVEHVVLASDNLKATNTARRPDKVVPVKGRGLKLADGRVRGKLPPRSYSMLRVAVGGR